MASVYHSPSATESLTAQQPHVFVTSRRTPRIRLPWLSLPQVRRRRRRLGILRAIEADDQVRGGSFRRNVTFGGGGHRTVYDVMDGQ